MVKSLMHWLRPYSQKTQSTESSSGHPHNATPNDNNNSLNKSSQNSSKKIMLHKITDIDDPADNPYILTGKNSNMTLINWAIKYLYLNLLTSWYTKIFLSFFRLSKSLKLPRLHAELIFVTQWNNQHLESSLGVRIFCGSLCSRFSFSHTCCNWRWKGHHYQNRLSCSSDFAHLLSGKYLLLFQKPYFNNQV